MDREEEAVGRTFPSTDAAHLVERAGRASHIAQSRLGLAVLKCAGPMLPTDGRCARLSIGAAAAKLQLSACPPAAPVPAAAADDRNRKQQASKWSLLRSELHRNSLLLRILQ
jgi:hypothetical protein